MNHYYTHELDFSSGRQLFGQKIPVITGEDFDIIFSSLGASKEKLERIRAKVLKALQEN